MEAAAWESAMQVIVTQHELEHADYQPGTNQVPGQATTGDDPLALDYADYGPLAFVLNEALDSLLGQGGDRASLLETVAHNADTTIDAVEQVLNDKNKCPDQAIIEAFANTMHLDPDILFDAAKRGGCQNLGPTTTPPPGY